MATITASAAGGNWNTNGAWVGSVQPTSADDVVISGTSTGVTIPAATTVSARSVNMTGGKLTFAATTSILNLGDASGGAFTASAGSTMTLTGVGVINFVSTSDNAGAGWNITTGGKTMPSVTFSGAGGKWVFQDAFTNGAAAVVTHTGGTLDTNGKTCSWGTYSASGATTKVLTLGATQLSLTAGANATAWTMGGSNMTLNPGTSTITFTRNGFNHGSAGFTGSYPAMVFQGGASAATMSISGTGSPTFASLTLTGVNKADGWAVATGLNLTVTGLLTCTGNSAVNRARLISATIGTATTIMAGSVSLSNINIRDVTAAGAATPWTGTSLGDLGGNTNITFTAGITRYWVVAAGTGTGSQSATTRWATASGGAGGASAPVLPQDSMIFDGSSFNGAGQTVTFDTPDLGALDFTNVTNNPSVAFSTAPSLYAAVTLKAGMTFSGAAVVLTLVGTGSHTLNTAGVNYDLGNVTIAARPGSTWTLGGALVTGATRTLTLTTGGLDANNQNVTVGLFASTGALTRALTMGSGTWTLAGTGTVWNLAAGGMTFSGASATITLTDTTATAKTFAGAGLAYGTFRQAATGTAALTITGSNTFVNLDLESTSARTVTLPASGTQTVTGTLTLIGTGATLSLVSSAPGTATNISLPGSLSQSGTVSRSADVLLKYTRPPSDTAVTASDSAAGVLGLQRTPSDTAATFSESAARQLALARAPADTATAFSETAARQLVLLRALTDQALDHSDAAARQLGIARTPADTATSFSEALTAVYALVRSPTDQAVTHSDDADRLASLARSAADTAVEHDDSAIRGFVFARFPSDQAVAFGEQLTRVLALSRALADTAVEFDEHANIAIEREAADTALVHDDAAARTIGLPREATDQALTHTDTLDRSLALRRAPLDVAVSLAETVGRSARYGRQTSTVAVTHSDLVTATRAYRRAAADAFTFADLGAVRLLSVALVEPLAVELDSEATEVVLRNAGTEVKWRLTS